MAPRTDDRLSVASPLVASCPTFEEATRTVDYLCDNGVARGALSVVADGLRTASEDGWGNDNRPRLRAGCGWVAGAVVGLVAGLAAGEPVVGAVMAVICALCGKAATATSSRFRSQTATAGGRELVIADRYYVISDQASARSARLLLRGGADAGAPRFEANWTPCVGSLPVRLPRRSHGEVTGGRRRPWRHRHPGTA